MLCWAITGLSTVVGNVITTAFRARVDNNSIALSPHTGSQASGCSYVNLQISLHCFRDWLEHKTINTEIN
jgi:hypothetical protein